MTKLFCTRCGESAFETEANSRFFFMRHGRTQMNEENRTVGSIDEPLNETGVRQSEEAAKRFFDTGMRFDAIVSSPMIRASRTAEIIGKVLGVPVITDNHLRERKAGILEGQLETPESDARLLRYDFKLEGMEPLEKFEEETKKFLKDIQEKYKGKTVLFVTHGFRMLTLIKLIHGWDVSRITAYEPPKNCEEIGFDVSSSCGKCGNTFFEKEKEEVLI